MSDFSLLHADYFTLLLFHLFYFFRFFWHKTDELAEKDFMEKIKKEDVKKLEFYGEYETICSRLRSRLLSILCLIFYLFAVYTFADLSFFFRSEFFFRSSEIMLSGFLTWLIVF